MGKARGKSRQRIKMGKSWVKENNRVENMVPKTNKKKAKNRQKMIENHKRENDIIEFFTWIKRQELIDSLNWQIDKIYST